MAPRRHVSFTTVAPPTTFFPDPYFPALFLTQNRKHDAQPCTLLSSLFLLSPAPERLTNPHHHYSGEFFRLIFVIRPVFTTKGRKCRIPPPSHHEGSKNDNSSCRSRPHDQFGLRLLWKVTSACSTPAGKCPSMGKGRLPFP